MKIRFFLISILALIMSTSCVSRKNLVYFQDEPVDEGLIESVPQQLTYKTDDMLNINVSAADPVTAQPFNLPVVAYSDDVVSAQGNVRLQTYVIDYDGNIDFPVLGKIKIAGLTRTEATDLLKERIKEYANEPIVNIRLANFTITVIGEVASPGTFTIQDERITLLEALGLARDLTIYGNRKNVLLIREVNGEKKFAKIDLTSINAVNSPLYYLQQNDVIVVEPNNVKIRQSNYNPNNGLILSAIGTLTTVIAVFVLK